MRIVYTKTAQRHIASQIGYIIDNGSARAAERMLKRILTYIRHTVAHYPKAARYDPELDIFETWVPRTPYVLLYRVDTQNDQLIVLALFHGAQDRSGYVP